jgi:hypothetical protein
MILTLEEQAMLAGEQGPAVQKAMRMLVALGTIYGAERMLPVSSVQIAGVSYDNLGEAGLAFLAEMATGGGQARVLTTLNPAGMDVENWPALGITPEFAEQQQRVLAAFERMGVVTTCTCTPYLSGNLPQFGEHLAWAESSAVCYANAVLGARTNREGGPSALAAALTGRTPAYGLHLPAARQPGVTVDVTAPLDTGAAATRDFGALGRALGEKLEALGRKPVPYLRGVPAAGLEALKAFCASLATYGGAAMFHIEGLTPEAAQMRPPEAALTISQDDLQAAIRAMSDAAPEEADFVSLGCPHLSLRELARLAELLRGQTVRKEFWVTTARPTKQIADRMGYTAVIEAAGAKFAVDTCCVVAPIKGRFRVLATDSAKACYYAAAKHKFQTTVLAFDDVVRNSLLPPPAAAGTKTLDDRPAVVLPAPAPGKSSPTHAAIQPQTLTARVIAPGQGRGAALVSEQGISFFGGVDPRTGVIVERGHALAGQSVCGRVLVFPTGKGSTVGSYTLYQLAYYGVAPAAIINTECETITAVGCIIAGIPCVDQVPSGTIPDGAQVKVDALRGVVEIT